MISIGSDPELVITRAGEKVSARFALTECPSLLQAGIDLDGAVDTAELRPKYGNTIEETNDNILKLVQAAVTRANEEGYGLVADSYKHYTSIGGHIHIGGLAPTHYAIYAFDTYLGVPLTWLSPTANLRIEKGGYGYLFDWRRADGTDRLDRWEYRTPPSWIVSPEVCSAVMTLSFRLAEAISKHEIDIIGQVICDDGPQSPMNINREVAIPKILSVWDNLAGTDKNVRLLIEYVKADKYWPDTTLNEQWLGIKAREDLLEWKQDWTAKICKELTSDVPAYVYSLHMDRGKYIQIKGPNVDFQKIKEILNDKHGVKEGCFIVRPKEQVKIGLPFYLSKTPDKAKEILKDIISALERAYFGKKEMCPVNRCKNCRQDFFGKGVLNSKGNGVLCPKCSRTDTTVCIYCGEDSRMHFIATSESGRFYCCPVCIETNHPTARRCSNGENCSQPNNEIIMHYDYISGECPYCFAETNNRQSRRPIHSMNGRAMYYMTEDAINRSIESFYAEMSAETCAHCEGDLDEYMIESGRRIMVSANIGEGPFSILFQTICSSCYRESETTLSPCANGCGFTAVFHERVLTHEDMLFDTSALVNGYCRTCRHVYNMEDE